jgi:hypothetical protein
VGNEDHRAVIAEEKFFQPGDGIDVEVVGRFVEQQEIRRAHQGARQHDLPAGPSGTIAEEFVFRQAQAGEHGFNFLIDVPTILRLDARLQLRETPQRIRACASRFVRDLMILCQERSQLAKAACDNLENGLIGVRRNLLLQMCDAQCFSAPNLTVVRYCRAGHDSE